jgi:hydroxyacylglutathione hydrolase
VKSQELARLIEKGSAPLIIDVRSGLEYRTGHIPGAVHIPLIKILIRLARYSGEKDRPVVITCEHGPRALLAKPIIAKAGFTRLELLEGHMAGWRKAGLSLER